MNTAPAEGFQQVCTDYKGTSICVRVFPNRSVALLIDGISRQSVDVSRLSSSTTRLSSTVQTDYEWHEYIVAVVELNESCAKVNILANNETIATREVEL